MLFHLWNRFSDSFNNYPTLENLQFGAVKLTKNADIDNNRYSGYGTGFDRRGPFSFPTGVSGCNVIIFGVYLSSAVQVDNKAKYILILGEDPTQGFDDTTLTAENKYWIDFSVTRKKFCLSLHYDGANRYLFVNDTEVTKAKDSKNVATPLCLGNISKDFSVSNMKNNRFYEYVIDFTVDYDAVTVAEIFHIHKYLKAHSQAWDNFLQPKVL